MDTSSGQKQKTQTQTESSTSLTSEDDLSLFAFRLNAALLQHKVDNLGEFETICSTFQRASINASNLKFKYERNRRQFNENILNELISMKNWISKGNALNAVDILDNASKEIEESNRHITIADTHGWDTLSKYLDCPLANNP